MSNSPSIKLYRHPLSGHAHRAELMLSLLGLDVELIDVDLLKGEHKQPEFLNKNAFGQVPVIEDGEQTVADSNAILVYLASNYDQSHQWLPLDPKVASNVQRFLSVAASAVANGPAKARLVNVFNAPYDIEQLIRDSHNLLGVLDAHLRDRRWLAADHATIADIANYTYIAHAPEGGVDLAPYPAVSAWLNRIEQLPGFVGMQKTAAGLAA